VIFANVLGSAVAATMNSIVSAAADAQTQGRTLGALSGLNSLMAVVAPAIGAPLLAAVSTLPRDDWRLGLPMFFCATLQGLALWLAWTHFRRERDTRPARPAPAACTPCHTTRSRSSTSAPRSRS
jgi:DHA1 family tetracycline resistance protein-like MFS transporter